MQKKINENLEQQRGGNVVLYIGLGFMATGLFVMVVGGGQTGFRYYVSEMKRKLIIFAGPKNFRSLVLF